LNIDVTKPFELTNALKLNTDDTSMTRMPLQSALLVFPIKIAQANTFSNCNLL